MAEQTQAIEQQESVLAPEISGTGVRADADFESFSAAMEQKKGKRGGSPEATPPAQEEAENKAKKGGNKAEANAKPSDGSQNAEPDGSEAGKKSQKPDGNLPKWMSKRLARSSEKIQQKDKENAELRAEINRLKSGNAQENAESPSDVESDLTGPNWENFHRETDDEATKDANDIAYKQAVEDWIHDRPYNRGPYAPTPDAVDADEAGDDPPLPPDSTPESQQPDPAIAEAAAKAEAEALEIKKRAASEALVEMVDALAKDDPDFQTTADNFVEAVFGEQKVMMSSAMAEHIVSMQDSSARKVIQTLLERPARAAIIFNKPEEQAISELNRIASLQPTLPDSSMPVADGGDSQVVVNDIHGVVGDESQIPLDTPDFEKFEERMAQNKERRNRAYRTF